jgi:hypothetical protein
MDGRIIHASIAGSYASTARKVPENLLVVSSPPAAIILPRYTTALPPLRGVGIGALSVQTFVAGSYSSFRSLGLAAPTPPAPSRPPIM